MDCSTADDMFTIEEWLRSMVAYPVTDSTIRAILAKRGVPPASELSLVAERDRDLCLGEMYLWCATVPSTGSSVKDSDADWSHEEGGYAFRDADKRRLLDLARSLFDKWDEPMIGVSKIRLFNF